MGLNSVWHWVLFLAIVLMVFGTKKIRTLGPDLGHAIRGFKKGLGGDEETKNKEEQETCSNEAEQLDADSRPAHQSKRQRQRDSSETR